MHFEIINIIMSALVRHSGFHDKQIGQKNKFYKIKSAQKVVSGPRTLNRINHTALQIKVLHNHNMEATHLDCTIQQ